YLFPTIFLLFFFSCYPAHRDLHSFPTRRSSDLLRRVTFEPKSSQIQLHRSLFPAHVQHNENRLTPARVFAEIGEHVRIITIHRQDRKSTRLNSSHLVISYAVFCLKKKKKKKKKK